MTTTAEPSDATERWLSHPIVATVRERYPDADPVGFLGALSRYLETLEDQFPGEDFTTILANGAEAISQALLNWKPVTIDEHDAVREIRNGASVYECAKKYGIHETRLRRLKARLA